MSGTRFSFNLDYGELIAMRKSIASSLRFVRGRLTKVGSNEGARRSLHKQLGRYERLAGKFGVPPEVLREEK